jgi:Protein of unknown function (DUF4231)
MTVDTQSSSPPDLGDLIDRFHLNENQKAFLRARWLDQLEWFGAKAKLSQKRYYLLRLVAIVGGLLVPALVSLNARQEEVASSVAWVTFAISLVVGISVAVDGFFNYGGRWRQYRRTSELLKAHGWQFFELVGLYGGFRDHRSAFPRFAAEVEALIAEDVEAYLSKVMHEQTHTPKTAPDDPEVGPES